MFNNPETLFITPWRKKGETETLFVILEYAKLAKVSPVLLIDDQWSVKDVDRQIAEDVRRDE